MTASRLPDGFQARHATLDDADAVAAVIAACETAHGHGTETTPASVRDDWQGTDLADETLVIEAEAGEVVAYGDIFNRSYVNISVYGYVHPGHLGRGLGGYIVDWGEHWTKDRMDRAEPGTRVAVRHYAPAGDEAALTLLPARGYQPVRVTNVMGTVLDAPPPEPIWPDGVWQDEYRAGVDELEIHETIEDAFRDVWGRPPNDYERFLAHSKSDGVRPDLWIVARSGNEIVGVCLGTLTDGKGWIEPVAVLRAWRRQGLGLALLRACLGAFHRRGVSDVRLSVDAESLTGAPRLYKRAGMHVVSSYILHEKELRVGIDTGDRSST